MKERWIQMIAQKALLALLYEVSASPKPGLVDRFNNGAHKDMDFFTFMASSASLVNYFFKCAEEGVKYSGQNPEELFRALRGVGVEAEKGMFEATKGVNTHKGLIFSLGVICAATSCCMEENTGESVVTDTVCAKVSQMTQGLCLRELALMDKWEGLTHGEKLYKKYGLQGIRGEVESGFPTVRNCSLPALKKLKSMDTFHINDILIQTLLHLMAVNEDTNIVSRHDIETLEYVQQYSRRVLDSGGMLTPHGRQMVYAMDREFIKRNISPGGSADLLAVTVMFDLISE
ncbi:triphosphoribosyl-dephospho-CoA synthase CitG [Desulfosporosinus orientis DSM 765]|uniref:Probable 2-(5''-triphosphoribosyl)-3'-dephosphocoenzyme-A synthase n=1 Tax=Desulfosporosinus orientis (strain ATCC 19365 / DSM 765 / NCIMB 8382 / VKM B-1628 / Singapore I) TaxID=768706 RepID=G7W710_DESOD|nr:triphosphoribosyl-dephospho-CoA synthase CitG [Desulfosporosinus orientis]AET69867.1 triphosphoribosyl-dephospho-CoA synthase CitG [Desulfosporosinus orientis DSM 765]